MAKGIDDAIQAGYEIQWLTPEDYQKCVPLLGSNSSPVENRHQLELALLAIGERSVGGKDGQGLNRSDYANLKPHLETVQAGREISQSLRPRVWRMLCKYAGQLHDQGFNVNDIADEEKRLLGEAKAAAKPVTKSDREPTQTELLLELAAEWTLINHDGQPFASVVKQNPDGSFRKDTYRFSRGGVRQQLIRSYRAAYDGMPSSEALQAAMSALEAQAAEGEQAVVWTRTGYHDGRIYLDLADSLGRVVMVSAQGWEITQDPPVYFQRSAGALPLPVPERGGSIDELRPFTNLVDDRNFILVAAWLLWSFFPRFSHPILLIEGPQGAAKSSLARLLRSLVDPSSVALRKCPKDEEALSMAAYNSWFYVIDNVSRIVDWFSDGLCGVSTGSGFSMRKLYSDNEESAISYLRPVIITGLQGLSGKTDLQERLIKVTLAPVQTRKLEEELTENSAWQEAYPRILGAFLDAASVALRNKGKNRLANLPRLADFAQCVSDAEEVLPWKSGDFIRVYWEHKTEHIEDVLEGDPLARSVRLLTDISNPWSGTATDLHERLSKLALEPRSLPSVRMLTSRLFLLEPNLREVGISIHCARVGHDRRRMITLSRGPGREEWGAASSAASAPLAIESGGLPNGRFGADDIADGTRPEGGRYRSERGDADATSSASDDMRTELCPHTGPDTQRFFLFADDADDIPLRSSESWSAASIEY